MRDPISSSQQILAVTSEISRLRNPAFPPKTVAPSQVGYGTAGRSDQIAYSPTADTSGRSCGCPTLGTWYSSVDGMRRCIGSSGTAIGISS